MKKQVHNKTFGKIIRTLGYLLILVSSAFFLVKMVVSDQIAGLPIIGEFAGIGQTVDDILVGFSFLTPTLATLGFIGGLLLLVWAIRHGIILKVLVTALLVFVLAIIALDGSTLLLPIAVVLPDGIKNIILVLESLLIDLIAISEYIVPGAFIALPILLWAVFAYKRPKRFALFLLRIAATTMFLGMALTAVPSLFDLSFGDNEYYQAVTAGLYVVSYGMFALGSAFGVLGFSRK